MNILPCPFCLKTNCSLSHAPAGFGIKMYIECKDCQAKGPFMIYEDDAIEYWNSVSQSVDSELKHKDQRDLMNYLADEIKAKADALKEIVK
jgi:hypothetical protein